VTDSPAPDSPDPEGSPAPDAPGDSRLPSGRLSRSARFGGLVAGQGLRWAGTRMANATRTPDRAAEATEARTLAVAQELVAQLGQMKGAAMKLGQVLSTVPLEGLPESEQERFKETLASLRDAAPAVPFRRMRGLIEEELGTSLGEAFATFEPEAFAAASIGQVHRARTHDGREVVVKVQYPGVAEAVEADLRNISLILPLVRRLAPGLDVKALGAELRERVSEELDYELEAQNQRAVERAYRGHPFVLVPRVDTRLSTRRVLVSDRIEGLAFEEVRRLDEAARDRFGEIIFRFFFGLLTNTGRCSGDPHPGNYLLGADGRVGFLDFGLMRTVDPGYLEGERAVARAVSAGDAGGVHAGLAGLGYLPDPSAFDPERLLGQLEVAGEWYFRPGFRRLDPVVVREAFEAGSSPRSPYFDQMRRQTLPPQALLIRRMEGLVFSVLGELRAGADWAAIAREYFAGEPPATELGEQDAGFWRAQPGGAPLPGRHAA
jgi:predicted unusual protein kinase regulating ubiquinone biosynthesis (AarF/ABC1/UbiB family)